MAVSASEYLALAEVRYRIRCFLVFSEACAREARVEPQQHQLLLAVSGLPAGMTPTIGQLAERLQIQHNSAVELVRRCADNGLVHKRPGADKREVVVALTRKGRAMLEKLTVAHRAELRSMAPALVDALTALVGQAGAA